MWFILAAPRYSWQMVLYIPVAVRFCCIGQCHACQFLSKSELWCVCQRKASWMLQQSDLIVCVNSVKADSCRCQIQIHVSIQYKLIHAAVILCHMCQYHASWLLQQSKFRFRRQWNTVKGQTWMPVSVSHISDSNRYIISHSAGRLGWQCQFHTFLTATDILSVIVHDLVAFIVSTALVPDWTLQTSNRDFNGWLLNVPATCQCISGADLLRQLYMLPQWDRSWRQNLLSHPQYTDTRPTSSSADPITPGTQQSSHWSTSF